jgi:hypothetical protein
MNHQQNLQCGRPLETLLEQLLENLKRDKNYVEAHLR